MIDYYVNNLDANKRKIVPSWDDYICYTTMQNGKFVLKNGRNIVLYTFSDEDDCKIKCQSIVDTLMNFYWQKEKEYKKHCFHNPSFYLKTYEEANWTHRALINGFISDRPDFNPYENYFGVSVPTSHGLYADALLKRGNKHIILSLQGMMIPSSITFSEEIKILFKNRAVKYISFFVNDKMVYETFSGIIPSMEFIEDFIKKDN